MSNHHDNPRITIHDERGVVAVELALIAPLILALLCVAADIGRVFHYANNTSQIAGNAARQAAVNKYPTSAQLKDQGNTEELRNGSSQVTTPLSVCVSFPAGGSPKVGDPVQVRASAEYRIGLFGLLDDFVAVPVPISGKATMRLEQVPTFSAGCTT